MLNWNKSPSDSHITYKYQNVKIYCMNNRESKTLIYNFTIEILTVLLLVFGVAPAFIGLVIFNLNLTYRGLNFLIISCALLLAMRTGYLSTNRDYWSNWRTKNTKLLDSLSSLTCIVSITLTAFLLYKGFYFQ